MTKWSEPVLPTAKIEPDLSQPEQIEMVDQERGGEHQKPAERKGGIHQRPAGLILDVPDNSTERTPLPEEQDERQAAGEDVGAALGGVRHHAEQNALEPWPRHHAVLDGEEAQEAQIDQQRRAEWGGRRRVERLRDHQIADKSCGIEIRHEEDAVGRSGRNRIPGVFSSHASVLSRASRATGVPGRVAFSNFCDGRRLKDVSGDECRCRMSNFGQFDSEPAGVDGVG